MKTIFNIALSAVLFAASASVFAGDFAESCVLDNGKFVMTTGDDQGPAIYTLGKDDTTAGTELRMVEGEKGVQVRYYSNNTAQGAVNYIRFHKGNLDYVLLNRDTAKGEFNGVEVHKNGKVIFSHQCVNGGGNLKLDFSSREDQLDDYTVADQFS